MVTLANGQVQALDLAGIDSELTVGYTLGFIQGDFAYFVPFNWGDMFRNTPLPDKVVRVDVNNFTAGGAKVLSLKTKAAFVAGGFTDGSYGYFPGSNGRLVRLDLQNFDDAGLTTLDLKAARSDFNQSSGGFSDGQYVYLLVSLSDGSQTIARIDVNQFAPEGVKFLDLAGVDKNLSLTGGCIDGQYAYFAGLFIADSASKIARIDLQDFTQSGVNVLDLASVDKGIGGVVYGGICHAGNFYVMPSDGKMTKIDGKNFTASGVTTLDLSKNEPALAGCVSSFTDEKYAYCLPFRFSADGKTMEGNGKLARLDFSNFSASGLTWLDLSVLNKNWSNFWEGMVDGKYIYLAPDSVHEDGMKNTSIVRVALDYTGWTK